MPRLGPMLRERRVGPSPDAWFIASDGLLGEFQNTWDAHAFGYCSPGDRGAMELWQSVRDTVLAEYAKQRPGKRPQFWWDCEAPRMSVTEVERRGWIKPWFGLHMPEARRQLSGTGVPDFERYGYVPQFSHGRPERWLEIDRDNPPAFESEAAFLKRNNLMLPGEEKRLKPQDFDPEVITISNEEEDN